MTFFCTISLTHCFNPFFETIFNINAQMDNALKYKPTTHPLYHNLCLWSSMDDNKVTGSLNSHSSGISEADFIKWSQLVTPASKTTLNNGAQMDFWFKPRSLFNIQINGVFLWLSRSDSWAEACWSVRQDEAESDHQNSSPQRPCMCFFPPLFWNSWKRTSALFDKFSWCLAEIARQNQTRRFVKERVGVDARQPAALAAWERQKAHSSHLPAFKSRVQTVTVALLFTVASWMHPELDFIRRACAFLRFNSKSSSLSSHQTALWK